MEIKLNKFEENMSEGTYKKEYEKNHTIIERKYMQIFGEETYQRKKEETQQLLYNHYKLLNSKTQIVKQKRHKTLEQFESEPDYLHILPYIKMQLIYYFKEQGIELQSVEQFLKLCAE